MVLCVWPSDERLVSGVTYRSPVSDLASMYYPSHKKLPKSTVLGSNVRLVAGELPRVLPPDLGAAMRTAIKAVVRVDSTSHRAAPIDG